MDLVKQAGLVFNDNFPSEAYFERAIFFSWYCEIRDCKFCYMSTQPDNPKYRIKGRRSTASLLAEVLLCRYLEWKIGFISGGVNVYDFDDFLGLVKNITHVYGKKVWANVGPLSKDQLEKLKPYIKGVVGSIESINPEVRNYMCPSKPIKPYEEMFKVADAVGLKNAMTIILGLGESIDDFKLLEEYIKEHNIVKIKFYALNPIKGSELEDYETPFPKYQAEWIARTRLAFPKLEISSGIWVDKIDRVSLLLEAGANYITKFPMIRAFGSEKARQVVAEVDKTGRNFKSKIVKLPDLDWDGIVDGLSLDDGLKSQVRSKLKQYLEKMSQS